MLLLIFSVGARAELNFQYNLLDSGYYLYERDVGDIDGDGRNDIVGIQEGDTTVQVFRAPNWARSTLITITGTYRYPRADDFKVADINGDGKLDVVTRLGIGPADDGAGIAVWYENLGGGNFTQRLSGNSLKNVKDIVGSVQRSGALISGPVPLPTKITRYTVLRSPHVDKKSREQFEIRTHVRMMDIVQPDAADRRPAHAVGSAGRGGCRDQTLPLARPANDAV